MKAKTFLWGACIAFAISSTAQAEVRIEALTPPLPMTLVGWGAFDTGSGKELEPAGIAFTNALYDGYVGLSDTRRADHDLKDGEHFNQKARTAARGTLVLPDEPTDRDIAEADRSVFKQAVVRLRAAYDRGGREVAPEDAATAQVSYDCWIEAAEYGREEDVRACRRAFESAMSRMEGVADYLITEAGSPAPMMAALPAQPVGFLVYFEWDSTTMTPAGRAAMREAIRTANASSDARLELTGHADRSGEIDYNQGLSERRALTVIDALSGAGVSSTRMSWTAVGELQPLIPTEDGVREQGNRVVEIDLH